MTELPKVTCAEEDCTNAGAVVCAALAEIAREISPITKKTRISPVFFATPTKFIQIPNPAPKVANSQKKLALYRL